MPESTIIQQSDRNSFAIKRGEGSGARKVGGRRVVYNVYRCAVEVRVQNVCLNMKKKTKEID